MFKVTDDGVLIDDATGKEISSGYVRLASHDFVKGLADEVDTLSPLSDYSNEIFLLFTLKKNEWKMQLGEVEKTDLSYECGGLYKTMWRSTVHEVSGVSKSSLFFDCTKSVSLMFFSFFILLCQGVLLIPYSFFRCINGEKKSCVRGHVCIVRTPATYSKLSKVAGNLGLELFSEDIVYSNEAIPSIFSVLYLKDFCRCFYLLPYIVLKDYVLIVRETIGVLGLSSVGHIVSYFRKRIVLKAMYEVAYRCICARRQVLVMYTGNKDDRFAVLESRLCQMYGKKLICIPHGLEYSFKFPSGLAGDIFYTTSIEASNYLNDLYKTDKYIYDAELIGQIYSDVDNNKAVGKEKKIVYFSESRDVHVNLEIVSILNELGLEFYVKRHPKDGLANYTELDFGVKFIDDYAYAIRNSICIARKSTVLLEALYNNSKSIAFLISPKDKYYAEHVFLSLKTSAIEHVFSKDELKFAVDRILEN